MSTIDPRSVQKKIEHKIQHEFDHFLPLVTTDPKNADNFSRMTLYNAFYIGFMRGAFYATDVAEQETLELLDDSGLLRHT